VTGLDVAVVVVTHDSAAHLPALLGSVPDALGDLRARVVFVDNASADGTVAHLRRHGRHEVVARPDNRGYAAAVNVGIEAAGDAPAVLVLNPDLRLGPGSVPALVAAGREPGVGIAVPQIRTPAGAVYPSLRREPTVARALGAAVLGGRVAGRYPRLSETVAEDGRYRRRGDVDWATGAAMLVTRACAAAVGPWDESFFLYSEETDFAHRARAAGFRVLYEPAARVTHTGGPGETSPRLRSMLVVNRLRYFRRRHGRLPSAAFHAALLGNELARAALGNRAALAAARGLVSPRSRPRELGCSDRLVPL
jgi:GT2 family glycosyltransferase